MKKKSRFLIIFYVMVLYLGIGNASSQKLSKQIFENPSAEFWPWVYWMWVNGNVTEEGTQKDLEAMHRVGINGAIILDVDQNSPEGPVLYNDSIWQRIFSTVARKSAELGMEFGANNGAGYWGTGGPWVEPEMAMQWVVSSETYVKGGEEKIIALKSPGLGADYRDIAVIAIAGIDTMISNREVIPDFPLKVCQYPGNAGPVRYSCAPSTYKSLQWPGFPRYFGYKGLNNLSFSEYVSKQSIISKNKIVDLTDKMQRNGLLRWDIPEGDWTIIRFGHQWTGSCIGPVIDKVRGPEIDKLSKEAVRFHFDKLVKNLKKTASNSSFTTIHIDSWEGGGQNWTVGFDSIFQVKRGYSIRPWLPVLTGRIVDSCQKTERFMFDFRQTISELFVENYIKEFQRLAHCNGLKFSYECYTTPASDLNAMQYVDVPMAEFWIPVGWHPNFDPTVKLMASAAHLNGQEIIAAEALTSSGDERWLWHPAKMKSLVDKAFCEGANRLVFHRYTSQPFDVKGPGFQMNIWGTKYERTNTWWEFSTPWHNYISRCQYMLRKGQFCADVLALQPEEPLYRFPGLSIQGYDYDVIGSEAFRKATVDEDGIHLPNHLVYKLLLLPDSEVMSLEMLEHIYDLVIQGGVILGNKPRYVPGLKNYKEDEKRLALLADKLWGDKDEKYRRVGKGLVLSQYKVEDALKVLGILPDFHSVDSLSFIHRKTTQEDIYFVVNNSTRECISRCNFRTSFNNVEVWDAENGQRYCAQILKDSLGIKQVLLPFNASKSFFIVFSERKNNLQSIQLKERRINEVTLLGKWDLYFPEGWGAPRKVEMECLKSWSDFEDEGIKYFSGTACYKKVINIESKMISVGKPLILDLGRVEVIARVRLNGHNIGEAWRFPYRFDIREYVHVGKNDLEVDIVNLWPNRLIGDEQYPDDIGYDSEGTMSRWPSWLINNEQRSSAGRQIFSARRQWFANDSLQLSGLLGDVKLFNLE